MLKIQWNQTARDDILAVVRHIAADNIDAAINLKSTIDKKLKLLATYPTMGRASFLAETREFVVAKNYIIVYQILNDDILLVLRILHAKQQRP